jgi:protein associated with RNAse G/E
MQDHTRPRLITVRATNFDGSFHWGHPATLLHVDDAIVVTQTPAGLTVKTEVGEYVSPFNTRAHYWPDRWFNVIRLELPDKGLYGFYCNIATPLSFDGETVHYVDLQLDVRVRVDEAGSLTWSRVDVDDFEVARERDANTEELVERARRAVDELIALVEARAFPFDG